MTTPATVESKATMSATVSRLALVDAVKACSKIVKPSKILDWMGSVRIRADDDGLEVCSCNIDSWVSVRIPQADVRGVGELLVAAELLHDLVDLCPSDTLHLGYDPAIDYLEIEAGSDEIYRLNAKAVEGFKDLPLYGAGDPSIVIDSPTLRLMAERSSEFASSETTARYLYHGVQLEMDGSQLVMAGTDGRAVGEARGKVISATSISQTRTVVLLGKWVEKLPAWLATDDPVSIWIADGYVLFRTGTLALCTTVLAGAYPLYKSVMDAEMPCAPVIQREAFIKGLKRAAVLTSSISKAVRLRFGRNVLEIVSSTSTGPAGEVGLDFGDASGSVRVPAEYEGQPLDLSFVPSLLLRGVSLSSDETVRIGVESPCKMAIIRGDSFTFAIASCRTA